MSPSASNTPATPNVEALIAALGGEVRAAVATLNGQIGTLTAEVRSARNDAAQSVAFVTKDVERLDSRVDSLAAIQDRRLGEIDRRVSDLEGSRGAVDTYGRVGKWILNAGLVIGAAVLGHFFQ